MSSKAPPIVFTSSCVCLVLPIPFVMHSQIKDQKSMLLLRSVTGQEPALPYLPTHLEKEYERAGIRAEVVLAVQQVIQSAHAGGALQQGGLHPMGKAEGRQVWASLSFGRVAVQHLHHCPGQAACVCLA